MNKIEIKNLSGKCLISMPENQGEFAKTVVFICSHDESGSIGFIINKRIKEFTFSDLTVSLPQHIQKSTPAVNLYNGGPLEKAKGFIIHSTEYQKDDSYTPSGGKISISSSLEVLKDLASGFGPDKSIIALGYACWAPNQLETEIASNMWLVTEATPELVFNTDDTLKWSQALSSLGILSDNLTPSYGHS